MGYEKTKAAIDSSFEQTGLDYIDLYAFYPLRRVFVSLTLHARFHGSIDFLNPHTLLRCSLTSDFRL